MRGRLQRAVERSRERLEVALAGDWSLTPGGQRAGGGHERVLVLTRERSPSVDYYVTGALTAAEAARHEVVTDAALPDWLGPGARRRLERPTRVLLVRMPAPRWAELLRRDAAQVTEVIWVLDDDVAAARDDPSLPSDFRRRLGSRTLRFRAACAPLIDRIWAASPAIAARFPADRVTLVPPRPITRPDRWQSPPLTLFYHGTRAHQREQEFLLPILTAVQAEHADTELELVGGDALYRRFRHLPRLRVIHPLPWPDYLGYLRSHPHHLGLVPLLDTPFNRGRSAVKLLELRALALPGLYSRRPPYAAHEGEPGVHLCDDEPASWMRQLGELLATLREGMAAPANVPLGPC